LLEQPDILAEDEPLRIHDAGNGGQKFVVKGLVQSAEIEQRDGLMV
jgi:hypothetical protein